MKHAALAELSPAEMLAELERLFALLTYLAEPWLSKSGPPSVSRSKAAALLYTVGASMERVRAIEAEIRRRMKWPPNLD